MRMHRNLPSLLEVLVLVQAAAMPLILILLAHHRRLQVDLSGPRNPLVNQKHLQPSARRRRKEDRSPRSHLESRLNPLEALLHHHPQAELAGLQDPLANRHHHHLNLSARKRRKDRSPRNLLASLPSHLANLPNHLASLPNPLVSPRNLLVAPHHPHHLTPYVLLHSSTLIEH